MALINASIPNLINGVSQQPPSLRLKTQGELQENAISSVVSGLSKRPCTEHIASLGTLANSDNAFIHTIRRDQNEFYTLVITSDGTNCTLRIFDKNGVAKDVNGTTSGFSTTSFAYLNGVTNPAQQIAATTVADYTFLLNKNKTVAKLSTKSPVTPKQALLYVKQADYSTKYTVTIKQGSNTYVREITTMASTQDTTSAVHQAEQSVQTDRLALSLAHNNTPDTIYTSNTTGGSSIPNMTFTEYGSVIHVQSTNNTDFTIEVDDSRGNNHIFAFKDKVADFKKLPPNGADGYVIAVVGDNSKGQDDYYVKLEKDDTGGQVWTECIAPDVHTSLDNATLPHQLLSNANGTFTLQTTTFKERLVGDDTTNFFPSFVDYKINDIFFHRNRLGLLSDENIILSEAGEFTAFNFFKRTTLTILDTDPIDVAVSNNKVSILKHAVPFNESLLLFSDLTQFKMTAENFLSPDTVAVDVSAQFEADLTAKPTSAGRYVFFGVDNGSFAGVREYFVDRNTETDDAVEISSHVPEYLSGTITKMESSTNLDMVLVLADGEPNSIFTYTYYWRNNEKLQSAWSKWTFQGKVLNASFNTSTIDLLIEYTGSTGVKQVCLERINLSTDSAELITEKKHPVLLDRRQTWTIATPVGTVEAPTSAGSLQYIDDKGNSLTQFQANTYVASGGTVFVGFKYDFRYVFSEQVLKSENEPLSRSRLQIRNMTVLFNDTGFFEVVLTPKNRSAVITQFTGRVLGSSSNVLNQVAIETGDFKFNVLGKASDVSIELKSSSYLPCFFQSAEWEGWFVMRSRRLN